MDDDQIQAIIAMLKAGVPLAWRAGEEYRRIVRFDQRREAWEPPEDDEPAAVFSNGEYVALYAVEPDDIVIFEVRPAISAGLLTESEETCDQSK